MTAVFDMTLAEVAAVLAGHLRAHFPADTLLEQQVMCVAEEAGEFLAAYRRWSGLARRRGPWQDVEAELADVVLATHVTAVLINGTMPVWDGTIRRVDTPGKAVRAVFAATAEVVEAFDCGQFMARDRHVVMALAEVTETVLAAAATLDIDLDAVWRPKAQRILDRPWRDTPEAAS